jgi:predicted RNA-binding protein YlxR (DUF448 family)
MYRLFSEPCVLERKPFKEKRILSTFEQDIVEKSIIQSSREKGGRHIYLCKQRQAFYGHIRNKG